MCAQFGSANEISGSQPRAWPGDCPGYACRGNSGSLLLSLGAGACSSNSLHLTQQAGVLRRELRRLAATPKFK